MTEQQHESWPGNLPILLIDDETDHVVCRYRRTGLRTAIAIPTKITRTTDINSLCGEYFVHSLDLPVGYTATPFANIFIHERGETRLEGPDLFPASFIINLAAPSNYIGPAKVFGVPGLDARTQGLPLTREMGDPEHPDGTLTWMPQTHKSTHVPLTEGQDRLPALVDRCHRRVLACVRRSACKATAERPFVDVGARHPFRGGPATGPPSGRRAHPTTETAAAAPYRQ